MIIARRMLWTYGLIFSFAVHSAPAGTNLLVNSSFEQVDAKGLPVGWQRLGQNSDTTVVTDDAVAHGGKRSVKLPSSDAAATEARAWSQGVACKPGEIFRLTAYFRNLGSVSSGANLRINWQDQNGRDISPYLPQQLPTTAAGSGNSWQLLQRADVAPPGATKAVVVLLGDQGQSGQKAATAVWVDDVRLETLTQPNDWGQFVAVPALQSQLSDFCWEFDRAVVAYAYFQDAVRGLRRARYYETVGKHARAPHAIEATLIEAERALANLRGRYQIIYPLVRGKPENGWPFSYAERKAAYQGNSDLSKELKQMTEAAAAALNTGLAGLKACEKQRAEKSLGLDAAWATPDLSGSPQPTTRLLFASDGRVDSILFGGKTMWAAESRVKHLRLMRYDFDGAYEELDWPRRDQLNWNDDKVTKPFAQQNIAVNVIVSYSNHGFVYCPQWLWPEILCDKDAFIAPCAVPAPNTPWYRFQFLNTSHPKVRAMLDEYLDRLGRHYRDDTSVAFYLGPWEAFDCKIDAAPTLDREGGRDTYSTQEFHADLKSRFNTIAALNTAWGTNYADFSSIIPPPSLPEDPKEPPSALGYAFQSFRRDRFMKWWQHCYAMLKNADPTHPVAADPDVGAYNADVGSAVDNYRLPETADIVSFHWNVLQTEMFWYLYSIGRFTSKTLGTLEHVWSGPECWGAPDEPVAAAAGQRNLWTGAALGVRVYHFYGNNDTYVPPASVLQKSFNNLMDFETDYTLFRPCAGVIPLMHSKLNALKAVWFDSKVVAPQVGVYQPSTAVNHRPTAQIVYDAAKTFERLLYPANIPHATVFEQAVLDGKDSLDSFRVLCLPYACVLPPAISEKLIRWVNDGGLLIAAGPFGMWDVTLREDMKAMRSLLPGVVPQRLASGQWALPDGAAFVDRAVGKGRVVMSVDWQFDKTFACKHDEKVLTLFRTPLMERISRPATADNADISLIVRDAPTGDRYVVVFNRNALGETRGLVSVDGAWRDAADLGIAGGWPVKLERRPGGAVFPVVLGAGEGTVIKLSKD